MKFFFFKWMKNYIPGECVSRLAGRYVEILQTYGMQYQSQRSLVAVHKSASVKAALAEAESRREKPSALLTRIAKLRPETRYVLSLPLRRKSDIDVTGRIGKRTERVTFARQEGTKFLLRLYTRSGTSLPDESRIGKTSFARMASSKLQGSSRCKRAGFR